MASKVHRVRYYNPKPESINCVSYNKISKHIAIARADASIEIWDLNYAPHLIKFIPGVEKGSVEALGWVGERLLSTGLGGALIEWDLNTLNVKNTVLLTGYAAWCLDVNTSNTLVAVGTEQGYMNLFNIENDDIVYRKLFDKQEGRIMCCKFDKEGSVLVTGSIDTIRVWNVETGHATCRILASRRGKETIVWSIAVLSDNVIVSGDSFGRLTFWDRVLGEQIESYTTHKGDILSIAVSEDEKSIFCSGVDPVIMNFVKVNSKSKKKTSLHWAKHIQRNIHEHDVRALVLNDERLVSVGADGYLTLSSYPPKWVMRIPHMIPTPRTSLCASKKLLLLRYSNYLEVWKLGSYATDEGGNVLFSNVNEKENGINEDVNVSIEQDIKLNTHHLVRTLQIEDNPLKLASISAKGRKQITCCDISPSGEFIVYATDGAIRMLKLEIDEEQSRILVSKLSVGVAGMEGKRGVCTRMAFSEDSRCLVTHTAGWLQIYHLDPVAGAAPHQIINLDKHLKSSSVLHVHLSGKCPSGLEYLVVAEARGGAAVWARGGETPAVFKPHAALPTHRCVPSALTVHCATETLTIVYTDQKIIEYNLVEKRVRDKSCELPAWSAPFGIGIHPSRPEALLLHDENNLWVWERNQEQPVEPAVKKRNKKQNTSSDLKGIPIKYLAGFHWIDSNEAVSVEVLPENIIAQLPPVHKAIY